MSHQLAFFQILVDYINIYDKIELTSMFSIPNPFPINKINIIQQTIENLIFLNNIVNNLSVSVGDKPKSEHNKTLKHIYNVLATIDY